MRLVGEAGIVFGAVVLPTEAVKVVDECRAAVVPGDAVVDLAAVGGDAAAWGSAVPVAGANERGLCGVGPAVGSAVGASGGVGSPAA